MSPNVAQQERPHRTEVHPSAKPWDPPPRRSREQGGRTPPVAPRTPADRPIVFYDGECGLCHASVNALLARDPGGVLRFAPLQGETAAELLSAADTGCLDSLVLLDGAGRSDRSTAVARILRHLGGRYAVLGWLFTAIPSPLRNFAYRAVAKVRYRVWGKTDGCRLPTAAERERFLP